MNGRQARGCGMSAHDMVKTSTKKTANSIVGKLTAGILATGAVFTSLLAPSAAASVIVVGDSLEVGSAPHLRAALAGMAVEIDAERGRTSSGGREGAGGPPASPARGRRVPPRDQRPERRRARGSADAAASAARSAGAGRRCACAPPRRDPVVAALRDVRTA